MMPKTCACCGSLVVQPAESTSALLAVCDVLTLKALHALGKWVIRADRSRYKIVKENSIPTHEAHTRWPSTDEIVDKALAGAWDVIPAMLSAHDWEVSADDISRVLDEYVHDLAITGTPHKVAELRYRLWSRLGIETTYVKELAHV